MVKNALSDKNVLYVVLFISCAVLLGYLVNNDFESVIFFCIVGFLLSHFSKNMTVVLGGTVIVTSLFKSMRVGREGFKEGVASDGDEDHDDHGDEDHEDGDKCNSFKKKSECDPQKCSWDSTDEKCGSKNKKKKDDKDHGDEDHDDDDSDGDSMAVMEGNRGMKASGRAKERAAARGVNLNPSQNEKTLEMAGKMINRLEGMLSRVEKFGGMFGGGN